MAEEMNEEMKKKVDEGWKDAVDKEKASPDKPDAQACGPEATFDLFIYGLLMEALIALGEAEHPITKKKEPNPAHSKFVIDTLGMLQSKTKGNLTEGESAMLEAILYDLRMKYVQIHTPKKT